MNFLALDTSTDFLSIALDYAGKRSLFHESVGQKHSDYTLPRIREMLASQSLTLGALDAVVFGQGPGSFTGVRIACGIAQGLAFSANLPVIGIPTLDSVAAQCPDGQVLVCLDARMGEVYHAGYQVSNGLPVRLTPITVGSPDHITLPEGDWFGAGDGLTLGTTPLAERLALRDANPALRPHAEALLSLAASGNYPSCPPEQAELLYIRNKVALTSREQNARRT